MENVCKTGKPRPVMSLRRGNSADFPVCSELWMRTLAARDSTPHDPAVRERAKAKLEGPGAVLVVAEGVAVGGFALATDTPSLDSPDGIRRAHLALLAVDPECQGTGLGRLLLAEITRELRAQGFAEATLSVLVENAAARRLYEEAGWQVSGHGVFESSGRPCTHYTLKLRD